MVKVKLNLCSSIDKETISRHALIEKDIALLGTRKEKIAAEAADFEQKNSTPEYRPCDADFLDERVKVGGVFVIEGKFVEIRMGLVRLS